MKIIMLTESEKPSRPVTIPAARANTAKPSAMPSLTLRFFSTTDFLSLGDGVVQGHLTWHHAA
jgi:hypothetical protein